MIKAVIYIFLLTINLYSFNIVEKYPSYSYVFNEFSVDEDYIHNYDFLTFIQKNSNRYKNFYKNSIKRGGSLIPTFKSMLLEDDLSDLLVYLAMVESGFELNALSSKSATGIWQFMSYTAKHYNLKVNSKFDERLDPILATNAAMRYLHKLYNDFGKWYLAVMAYNCGEGRMKKAIRKANSDELSIVIKYLPKETQLYMYKVLLVAMIGENISLGFSDDLNEVSDIYGDEVIQVEVEAGENIKYIAKMIGMKSNNLSKLNHHFKNGIIPVSLPKYIINIPSDKVVDFYTQYELKKELNRASKCCFISHFVEREDTLNIISKKYKIRVSDLIKFNNIKNGKVIIDKILIIPVSKKMFDKFLNKVNK